MAIKYPSERYFELVKTKEDHDKFLSSGMAWVVEPNCPATWGAHLAIIMEIDDSEQVKEIEEKSVGNKEGDMLATAHWSYVSDVLKTHGLADREIEQIGFHYKSAFIHGFKHGVESVKENESK